MNYTADASPGQTPLAPRHLDMLTRGSGISAEVIAARGYRTVTDPGELEALGFSVAQRRVPGLLLPLWTTDGSNGIGVYRPDSPRTVEERSKRNPDGTHPCRVLKYEVPKDSGTRLDCPPTCRPSLGDPTVPLWITEGQKKADALVSHRLCAIALLGVWNWRGKNDVGGVTFLADWDHVALNGRDVRIVFDSDIMTKPAVRGALDRLTEHLQRRKAHVAAVYLPTSGNGDKQGVDDYLTAGHSLEELEALVTGPRPAPIAAAPIVELLDAPLPALRRPLTLIDGRAYAATWAHARVIRTESQNSKGEIVRHDPPIVTTEQRLVVIRDDGRIYADGQGAGDQQLDELGFEVTLGEIPPTDRLWSVPGIKRYRAGHRPDPADVFARVTDTIDRFIDFDRSLADQRTMAEMVSAYVLSTWNLDAFNVIGFLWPNGDRGSGKTQLLTIICELGYLGQVILSGGSFAALRDLADYGACLAFDDAESLSDPRKTDPDKRSLLLAGNRRGNTVPLKELTGAKTWRTRYVNTFCPRLFSATELPDPILASRTIVVPLIRTADRFKGNADPLEYRLWPHDRRALLDDLWALALSRLAELPPYEAQVNERARLVGRSLEPWRPLLAVAAWLDDRGVAGLWDRFEALSVAYQEERPTLEAGDITALTVQALCAKCANLAKCANTQETLPFFDVTSAEVREHALTIIKDDEMGIDTTEVTPQRIGKVFHKMRLKKPPRPGGKGSRLWRATLGDVEHLARAYGLPLPDELKKLETETPIPSLQLGTLGTLGILGPPGPEPVAEDWEEFDL